MTPLLLRLVVVASPKNAVKVFKPPQGLPNVPRKFPPAEEETISPPDDIPAKALMVLFVSKSFTVSKFAVIPKPTTTFEEKEAFSVLDRAPLHLLSSVLQSKTWQSVLCVRQRNETPHHDANPPSFDPNSAPSTPLFHTCIARLGSLPTPTTRFDV
jgi:hypothetical protein